MLSVLLVLQGMLFAPLQDSVALKATADSFGIPTEVIYAVAWKESRTGEHWNRLGPGVIDSTWVNNTLTVRRTCREVGRFQLRSCVNWIRLLRDSKCSTRRMRDEYRISIHCGARNLRRLFDRYGSWLEAIRRQNGAGPKADFYLLEALAYIGWRRVGGTTAGN